MDYIKNKESVIASVNELIDICGSCEQIAEFIDSLIFDYLYLVFRKEECGSDYEADRIFYIKEVRNFFLEIKKNCE